jgi:hypothetical protein
MEEKGAEIPVIDIPIKVIADAFDSFKYIRILYPH